MVTRMVPRMNPPMGSELRLTAYPAILYLIFRSSKCAEGHIIKIKYTTEPYCFAVSFFHVSYDDDFSLDGQHPAG